MDKFLVSYRPRHETLSIHEGAVTSGHVSNINQKSCPHCGSVRVKRNGWNGRKCRLRRWRCRECGRSWTPNGSGKTKAKSREFRERLAVCVLAGMRPGETAKLLGCSLWWIGLQRRAARERLRAQPAPADVGKDAGSTRS